MPPQIGQPFTAGAKLSVGDPEALPGTVAFQGVIVTEPAPEVASAAVINYAQPFKIKAYFKMVTAMPWVIPANWHVDFYIIDLEGTIVNGVSYPHTNFTDPEPPPDGAVATPAPLFEKWFSYEVDIPANDLNADTIYRISVDGDDSPGPPPPFYFAFHDLTVIKTTAP